MLASRSRTTMSQLQSKLQLETRAHIARIGRLLFERHLTDSAGGNVSVRVGDQVCITPRYSGQSRQWQVDPEDVLVVHLERNLLDRDRQVSRESKVHLKPHQEIPHARSPRIHTHAPALL